LLLYGTRGNGSPLLPSSLRPCTCVLHCIFQMVNTSCALNDQSPCGWNSPRFTNRVIWALKQHKPRDVFLNSEQQLQQNFDDFAVLVDAKQETNCFPVDFISRANFAWQSAEKWPLLFCSLKFHHTFYQSVFFEPIATVINIIADVLDSYMTPHWCPHTCSCFSKCSALAPSVHRFIAAVTCQRSHSWNYLQAWSSLGPWLHNL